MVHCPLGGVESEGSYSKLSRMRFLFNMVPLPQEPGLQLEIMKKRAMIFRGKLVTENKVVLIPPMIQSMQSEY